MEERIVEVRNKDGVLLAKFSNKTPAQSNYDKKNLMVSPTIDITSNGDSTLSFQMFVNSEKWQQIKDPENLYYCNGRVYTALHENSFVITGQVVNATLVELWYLLGYKYVQAHNVDTSVEALDEHTVKILPKTSSKFKLTVNGVKYNDSEVKDSRGIVMPRGSAGYALWALLRGTDWNLGVCDVLPDGFDAEKDYGTFNVESDMKDVLQNIQLVQQLYGGILDWDSMNKVLNLRDERKEGTDFNTWKGYAIRKGKNTSEYPTITWDNSLITRLYPLGNGNLNIKKVNNNKGYVDNFSYTNKIYEGYMQNANIYDTNDTGGQKTLKFWAEQQVEKYCRPRKSISYSVVDVRAVEAQAHESVDVNDVVKAYYQDTESGKEVYEYLRVQHISYNWFFPSSDSTIEVGDKVSNEVELFYQIYKKSENSAQTDANGHLSGDDIYLAIPEEYWDSLAGGAFGYASLQTITNLHAEHETENTLAISDLRVYADDTFATITSFTSFQEWTENEFSASSTRIDQVSSALYAQIDLEATHHKESLKYTQDSVAALQLYVEGDFARATLRAAYSYTDKETEKISDSLADFEAYADKTYATTSQLSRYATYNDVGKLISQSEASVKTYADQNYARVSITATVNDINERTEGIDNRGGYVVVDSRHVKMGYPYGGQLFISESGLVTLAAGTFQIGTTNGISIYTNGSLSIQGKTVYWSNGFLRGE